MQLNTNFAEKLETSKFVPALVKPDLRAIHERHDGRLIQVIWNTDMRNSHDGLAEIAKKKGIKLEDLKPGQFLCFINTDKSHMKVFTAYYVGDKLYTAVASHRSPSGRIEVRALKYITAAFGGSGKIDMDSALKRALEEILTPKRAAKLVEKEGNA